MMVCGILIEFFGTVDGHFCWGFIKLFCILKLKTQKMFKKIKMPPKAVTPTPKTNQHDFSILNLNFSRLKLNENELKKTSSKYKLNYLIN